MSLNRREMLRLGAAGAGGLLLSSAASSQMLAVIDPSLGRRPDRAGGAAAAPRRSTPLGDQSGTLFQRPRPRSIRTPGIRDSRFIGIVDFSLRRRATRASMSSICRAARSKAIRVAHGRGSDPDHIGLRRALLEPASVRKPPRTAPTPPPKLSRQIRPFDEGPRPRLVQQQCRVPRHRDPQCLVCRAGHDRRSTASSAAPKAASRSAAQTSGR